MEKVAKAIRVAGNLYDVFYLNHADCDFKVPGEYLDRLRHKGYTVEVDQHMCRGEGEPSHETLEPLDD